jgi:hypothetical protein
MPDSPEIPIYKPGDRLHADTVNTLVQGHRAFMGSGLKNSFVDSTGVHTRDLPKSAGVIEDYIQVSQYLATQTLKAAADDVIYTNLLFDQLNEKSNNFSFTEGLPGVSTITVPSDGIYVVQGSSNCGYSSGNPASLHEDGTYAIILITTGLQGTSSTAVNTTYLSSFHYDRDHVSGSTGTYVSWYKLLNFTAGGTITLRARIGLGLTAESLTFNLEKNLLSIMRIS